MSTYRLEKIFEPRSVALVGASQREGALGQHGAAESARGGLCGASEGDTIISSRIPSKIQGSSGKVRARVQHGMAVLAAAAIRHNFLLRRRTEVGRANVLLLFMAWSPARRSNAGNQGCEPRRLRNPYSNHPRDSTSRRSGWHGRGAHTAVGDCDERLMLRPIVPVEHPMRHALRKAQVQDALRIAR